MNRSEWLRKLEKELHKLPEKDRDDAMEYYREYFEEAGSENEEEILAELGTPGKIASEIKADYAVTKLEENERPGKNPKIKWILLAIAGGIMSAPVTLPLMIILIALAAVGAVCVICLILALAACVIGGFAAGVLAVCCGVKAALAGAAAGAALGIGCGLMAMALMALAGYGVFILLRKFLRFVSRKVKESNEKRRIRKEEKQKKRELKKQGEEGAVK